MNGTTYITPVVSKSDSARCRGLLLDLLKFIFVSRVNHAFERFWRPTERNRLADASCMGTLGYSRAFTNTVVHRL
jgi:hypothetical protein